jgi:hypothetical protein
VSGLFPLLLARCNVGVRQLRVSAELIRRLESRQESRFLSLRGGLGCLGFRNSIPFLVVHASVKEKERMAMTISE